MDIRYENVEQYLDEYVALLNALSWEYAPWGVPKAHKQHKCEFGCLIEPGDGYYRKPWTSDRGQDVKLCRTCMVKMLFALFGTDQETTKRALAIDKDRWDTAVRTLRALRDPPESNGTADS
jgi:hypothetical protein